MCGRYSLDEDPNYIARHFKVSNKTVESIHPNYNVAPTQQMPVITLENNNKQLQFMYWGIPRVLGKNLIKELINTRSDKAFGGFWKKTVLNKRCLVPASGFYEWKKLADGKQPYFIHPKEENLFSFAGIWDIWKSKDGDEVKTFSIMTTEPSKEMSEIHNRMPVILHKQDEDEWLKDPKDITPDDIQLLLRPYDDNGLEIYPVSRAVNNVHNNDKHLTRPLASDS